MASNALHHALTIDVEDYYQVGVFQDRLARSEWEHFESRVGRNLDVILQLLEDRQIHATFFILGWLAEKYPAAIRRLADLGHEIASHGYGHEPLWKLTPATFRDDLVHSLDAIEAATGIRPDTYRAPCFSLTAKTLWALDILHAAGIRYDSSIFPIHHPDYGIPGAERRIHIIRTPSGGRLTEFPMTTSRVFSKNVAFCGGGYFRLLPYWVTSRALRAVENRGEAFVFYLHPWEIDPAQPRLKDRASRLGRFRHYVNLDRNQRKFERLLDDFRFGTMREVLRHAEGASKLRELSYTGSLSQ